MPYASNRGVKLHYEVFGEGPPLFLHVGLGGEWDLWKLAGFLDCLKGFKLIINDPRGFGSSDRPKTAASYRMTNAVQDVVTILDDLQVSKCSFWGHSAGAHVGEAFADAHPNRLSALISAGGAVGPNDEEDLRDFAKFVHESGMGFLGKLFEKSYGQKLPLWYTRERALRDPAIVGLQLLGRGIPWAREAWTVYPRIKVPTLIIVGDKEDPTGVSKKIAKVMPQARCVVLKGLTPSSSDVMLNHIDELMRSDVSVPIARRFLRKHM